MFFIFQSCGKLIWMPGVLSVYIKKPFLSGLEEISAGEASCALDAEGAGCRTIGGGELFPQPASRKMIRKPDR